MKLTLYQVASAALGKFNNDPNLALDSFIKELRTNFDFVKALALNYLQTVAAKGEPIPEKQIIGSIIVTPHDVPQHRRRTHAQKQAAKAMLVADADNPFDFQIGGHAIGNLRWGQLNELKRGSVKSATQKILWGLDDVMCSRLIHLLQNHCTVDDQLVRVRDVIKPGQLAKFIEQAKREAPAYAEYAIEKAAEIMEQRIAS